MPAVWAKWMPFIAALCVHFGLWDQPQLIVLSSLTSVVYFKYLGAGCWLPDLWTVGFQVSGNILVVDFEHRFFTSCPFLTFTH